MSMREAAEQVVRALQAAGHVAMFAGGCVRDMLMGREPTDYDVATSAPPPDVVRSFRRTQEVGAKFGVVLVFEGGHAIEVATFRRDLEYADGRHPSGVEFTDAREDAIRRDFTINGMFFDPIRGQVIDHVGGQADIGARLIRAIGDPQRRFTEDHLRLLRAIRFAAGLGFDIEPATRAAMKAHAPEIVRISPERIREELERMLAHAGRARAFAELRETGLLRYLWPKAALVLDRAEMIQATLAALPESAGFELAMSAIMQQTDPYEVEAACDALRCSNDSKKAISWIVAHEMDLDEPRRLTLADLKLLMANSPFAELLALVGARCRALGHPPAAAYEEVRSRAAAIPAAEVSPPPLVSGHDLAELGVRQGPVYKRILDRIYYAQLNGEVVDARSALEMARRLAAESDNE